jgi:cytochrome bd-type quinol oxidase subunit 2
VRGDRLARNQYASGRPPAVFEHKIVIPGCADRVFLEASFLGVLLFGRRLVPQRAHVFAAATVFAGTLFSAFWILAANSWMQTPAGFAVEAGRFYPADWWAVVFSPSFPYRLAHMVNAAFITTGFVVLSIAAHYLRAGRALAESRRMLSMTLWLLTVLVRSKSCSAISTASIRATTSRKSSRLWRAIDRGAEILPFLLGVALFAMGYIGLAISLWDAAASPRQAFLLLGTLFLLPVILGYTAWSYWIFRGQVRASAGYH